MNVAKIAERFHALPAPSPADVLTLRDGSLRDYAALAEHHYRSQRPATATRVLVLEDPRPGVAARFGGGRGGGVPPGVGENNLTRPVRPRLRGEEGSGSGVVAVLVESLPSLGCAMRGYALRERYGSHLPARSRALLLNAEVRCISRVVIDPRWRGLGLAVRLVRHALATATTRYTEALAAMGHVNPFFERAGMTAYPRPTHPHDARLVAALARVGIATGGLALVDTAAARIEALPSNDGAWLRAELRRWSRQYVGRGRRRGADDRLVEQLTAARDRLLFEPVYYLYCGRDGENERRRDGVKQEQSSSRTPLS